MKREKRQSALRDVRVRPGAAVRCFLRTCADAVSKQIEKRKPIRTNLYAWYSVRDELNMLGSQDRIDKEPSRGICSPKETNQRVALSPTMMRSLEINCTLSSASRLLYARWNVPIVPSKARVNSLRLVHILGHGRKIGNREAVSAPNDGPVCRVIPSTRYLSRTGERRLPAVPTATLYAECGVAILALLSSRLEPSTGPSSRGILPKTT